ncbi:hypothetical protein [Novosphingobium kaempferiae]|uniref:hypothetical protein n=1 Tax=Novosphingobium kaempferiae TaxID=2896849 RepID=UPI001E28EB96|nr:hypothetical protein [Novosphingobium kaempferiae]
MTARTSAGTTLAISSASPASFDATGFAALTYSNIGEITEIGGDLGRVYNVVTHNPLATRATVKKKGSFNSGSAQITLAIDSADAGQTMAQAALDSDATYAFKLTEQSGRVRYFQGIVVGFPVNYNNVDAITTGVLTVEVTANAAGLDYVTVPAP